MNNRRSWFLPAAASGILFAALLASAFHEIGKHHVGAFNTYYRAAAALGAGQSPYDAGTHTSYPYVYPPFYAFLCQPLTRLPIESAARVMALVNTGFLLAAVLLAASAMTRRIAKRPDLTLWVAFTTTLFSLVQIHKELGGLQAGILLPFSFALALYCIDRRPILAGLALAFAISIKYVPIIALPYLLLRRRWTAAAACMIGVVAFALLPAVSLGWSTNLRFLAMAHGGLARIVGASPGVGAAQTHGLDDPLNVTVPGTLARFVKMMSWPAAVAAALTLAVAAAWLIILIRSYQRRRVPLLRWPPPPAQQSPPFDALFALEWAALVIVAVSFSPNTQLVQAIIPAALLSALVWSPQSYPSFVRRLALVSALVLAALTFPMAAMGKSFTAAWNLVGAPAWLLLAAYLALVPVVLDRVRIPAPAPAPSPAPGGLKPAISIGS